MSLRGIDAQMALTRTAELQRQPAETQKTTLMSEYLNVEGKLKSEQAGEKVAEMPNSDRTELRPGEDGGGDSYEPSSGERRRREDSLIPEEPRRGYIRADGVDITI
ncbi:MAG: hypothetical protein LBN00_02140 [Oscillospiraceae bacterium]|jgi:hypothetical protein|nr:hypothetical protein [Oscillospiraceae bacterium]